MASALDFMVGQGYPADLFDRVTPDQFDLLYNAAFERAKARAKSGLF